MLFRVHLFEYTKHLSTSEIVVDVENSHLSFTISIGQTLATNDSNLDYLYAEAGKSLYKAKKNGINQVVKFMN